MKLADLIDVVNASDVLYRVLDVVEKTELKEFTERLRTVHEWNGGRGITEREELLDAVKKLLRVAENIRQTGVTTRMEG